MPADAYIVVDDVHQAEEAARHAGLVSIQEQAGNMVLRFNNGVQLTIHSESIQIIETGAWRP